MSRVINSGCPRSSRSRASRVSWAQSSNIMCPSTCDCAKAARTNAGDTCPSRTQRSFPRWASRAIRYSVLPTPDPPVTTRMRTQRLERCREVAASESGASAQHSQSFGSAPSADSDTAMPEAFGNQSWRGICQTSVVGPSSFHRTASHNPSAPATSGRMSVSVKPRALSRSELALQHGARAPALICSWLEAQAYARAPADGSRSSASSRWRWSWWLQSSSRPSCTECPCESSG